MKKIILIVFVMIISWGNFGKALASGNGIEVFDLSKPLTLSWALPKNVVTVKPVLDRNVNIAISDPWNPVDFETSFKLAEKGQNDNMVVMNGSTNIPVVLGHSGTLHGYDQLLNWLRNYLQGGWTNADKSRMKINDPATEERQMNNLKGAKMTLSQESIVQRSWSVAFVVKIDHKEVPNFSASADSAVVTTTQAMNKEELQEFLQRSNNGEKPIFLVTCYWGTVLKTANGKPVSGWGSYGRYVAVMFPDMPPDVK